MIQVRDTGKVTEPPEKAFQEMRSAVIGEMEKKLDEVAGSVSFLDSASLDDSLVDFDREKHVIWVGARSRVANVGPVASAMAICLTEKGIIRVGLAVRESEFAYYLPVFRHIVNSIHFGPSLRYRPVQQPTGAKSARQVFGEAFSRMLEKAGGLLILVLLFGGICVLMLLPRLLREKRLLRRLDRALHAGDLTEARAALGELKRFTDDTIQSVRRDAEKQATAKWTRNGKERVRNEALATEQTYLDRLQDYEGRVRRLEKKLSS